MVYTNNIGNHILNVMGLFLKLELSWYRFVVSFCGFTYVLSGTAAHGVHHAVVLEGWFGAQW